MLSWDWIDSWQYVPIDVGSAGRSSNRSFVNPSVFHVEQHHDVSIGGNVDNGSSHGLICPLLTVKEGVDHHLLGCRKLRGVILNRKQNAHSCLNETVVCLSVYWVVHRVHFQIVSLAVNGVFWSRMEMELNAFEVFVSAVYLFCHLRRERTDTSIRGRRKIHLLGMPEPLGVGPKLVDIRLRDIVLLLIINVVFGTVGLQGY